MANKVRHTLHRKSNVNKDFKLTINKNKKLSVNVKNPKAPKTTDIEYGEIAINYGKGSESIFIKNSDDELVRMNSIKNIRYDGEVDNSLNAYLDDRYVNTSGDTIDGDLKILGNTKISGDVNFNGEINIPNPNYPSVEGAPEFKKNDCLGKNIKVIGIKIGDYQTANEIIPVGTPIEEILDKILCKTIGVTPQEPTVSISNSGTKAGTYEVGTEITPQLSHTYTDGYFEGAEDLYIDEKTGEKYKIKAGCKEDKTTYYKNNISIGDGVTSHTITIQEETLSYTCKTTYNESKADPKDTKGKSTNTKIAAGTAESNSISYYGRYKYYMGYINKTTNITEDDIKNHLASQKIGNINPNAITTIYEGPTTSNGYSIVISVPEKYNLRTINDNLGPSLLSQFKIQEQRIDMTIGGGNTTNYKVIIWPITTGAKITFKNVTIG